MMRTLPRALIGAAGGLVALALVASAALAHGSGGAHDMPGAGGGAMGPGMMGGMGGDVIELMGRWMSGHGQSEHPGTGAEGPPGPQMPAMPEMPGQGMTPGTDGPRMPRMPAMPGQDGMPGMRMPGFQLQMTPGWSG
jgi:hypothetical protein